MKYNWQQKDWPQFKYDLAICEGKLFQIAEGVGRVSGLLKGLNNDLEQQTLIDVMVSEAVKTSEIEGEFISRQDVISSIRNNLGLNKFPEQIKDKRAEGISRLMVESRKHYQDELDTKMLFSWHSMMMESHINIRKGQWRIGKEPMQVISGRSGKEVIHYEAPPSKQVPKEMDRFIEWYNNTAAEGPIAISHGPVRSAIAHLYFESIHPFEDGNGRIGRAISEKALSQGLKRPTLLSLSKAIESKRSVYYEALKKGQSSNEISEWISYFCDIILIAQKQAEKQITFTLRKSLFFDGLRDKLNVRQEKVIGRMLEAGPNGFQGGMNTKKYISITKTSKATATRDLQQLVELGVFIVIGGGRSTRYEIDINGNGNSPSDVKLRD